MKIWIYDFEVFKKFWMIVLIEYNTNEKVIIKNNRDELIKFYEEHAKDIFVGYNSRGYDQFIFKGILNGQSPWEINKGIIVDGNSGYKVTRNFNKYHFNNFDIQTGFHSLKQLEGFMGSSIKESDVDFKITRPLTAEEIDLTEQYCIHDVEETAKVFTELRQEFDSQLLLIEAFDLDMDKFNKTKAQLSAHVLGAKRSIPWTDEFDLSFPDTLILSDKYKYILDWYKDELNMDYSKKLKTTISGVPHVFAWGGIHGALLNYIDEGEFIMSDIASMYPALMIEYDYLSRNVMEPQKYKEIRDTRIELKKKKDKKQLPLKIVLNSTYGAMKDKFNDLYDPLMANNVCVAGQLLLLDLIEKVEPYGDLIQSNTDGILVKLYKGQRNNYINACDEWCRRTRLDLEHDDYVKVVQKDVNNYIIVEPNGKYKSKGAYVKKLSEIDYDLPILNDALINYFIHDIPIEDTINSSNDLRKFQQIVKISRKYIGAFHGEIPIHERVIRVFASTKESDEGIFKKKTTDATYEKVPKTPEHAFIYNESVNDMAPPCHLDREHYIEMAKGRLDDFIYGKSKSNAASDIKGVVIPIKEKLIAFIDTSTHDDFFSFLCELHKEIPVKKNHVITMIRLDYMQRFGNSKYLESYFNLFKEFWDNKNVKLKEKITSARVDKLGLSQDLFNSFATKEKKNYINIAVKNIIEFSLDPKEDYTEIEKIRYNYKYKNTFDYYNDIPEYKMVLFAKKIFNGEKPYGIFQSIGSGKTVKLIMLPRHAEDITEFEIIKAEKLKQIPKLVYSKSLHKMIASESEKEWVLERFTKDERHSLTEEIC